MNPSSGVMILGISSDVMPSRPESIDISTIQYNLFVVLVDELMNWTDLVTLFEGLFCDFLLPIQDDLQLRPHQPRPVA